VDREKRGLKCPIGGSVDGAWMTRGNGKCSTSKSGHGSIMGIYSSEVMASDGRHLHCHACRTKSASEHKCHKNWSGSSKAMEADIIAKLVLNAPAFEAENARITAIVGDEDSATMSKIVEIVPWKVKKISDVVHAKKNFGGGLYAAKHKLLTTPIINYVKDCFSYALHQNRDDTVGLKAALLNIPEHIFNNHSECGDWCGYTKDPEGYKHRRLPETWKGPEENQVTLKRLILQICEKFAAKASSLAPCLSSNANECFNFLVTTLAPKSRHYGGSFSINRRIHGAVLQKNDGVQFVISVNKDLKLSPGQHTIAYKKAVAEQRKRKVLMSQNPEQKAKRRKDFKKALNEQLQKEASEGVQYQSGMGFGSTTVAENCPQSTQNNPPKEKITKPTGPKKRNIPSGTKIADRIENSVDFETVVFDTETTGLSNKDEILQLAAQSSKGAINFYCKPTVDITQKAFEKHKIEYDKLTDQLRQDKKLVTAVERKDMLAQFTQFLSSHKKKVLLVAHNAPFDMRFLYRELLSTALADEFEEAVAGICDSVLYFKNVLPDLDSYAQGLVVKKVLGTGYHFKEHQADADVSALVQALKKVGYDDGAGRQFSIRMIPYAQNLKNNIAANSLFEFCDKKITIGVAKSLVQKNFDAARLVRLSENKEEFVNLVSKCFRREPKKRSEDIFNLFNK